MRINYKFKFRKKLIDFHSHRLLQLSHLAKWVFYLQQCNPHLKSKAGATKRKNSDDVKLDCAEKTAIIKIPFCNTSDFRYNEIDE